MTEAQKLRLPSLSRRVRNSKVPNEITHRLTVFAAAFRHPEYSTSQVNIDPSRHVYSRYTQPVRSELEHFLSEINVRDLVSLYY